VITKRGYGALPTNRGFGGQNSEAGFIRYSIQPVSIQLWLGAGSLIQCGATRHAAAVFRELLV
jgi:hypothetical protein